ncbi:hypothetical protein WN48_07704 [Eufriesea mexicana]|uniref:Uncharacterized protein n=1 Tax=Eufriesea mexicana TaxID=516756 RepID=A0A310SSA0_9HYME|nr:hypothetical protein WN48_07704 [Eufriesea mexicana]
MCDFPGGLFHPSDDKQDVAFRYAVEKINNNRDILPKSRLSAQIEQIKPQDSFHASKRGLEWFVELGIAARVSERSLINGATFFLPNLGKKGRKRVNSPTIVSSNWDPGFRYRR